MAEGLNLVPWERRWLPLDADREGAVQSTGFLESWEEISGVESKDGPKRLEELLRFRCLVLCGEPGMGKSKTLELHRHDIEDKARHRGEFYARSFREAIDPFHLLQDLKCSSQWQKWAGGSELTVVIDGVDEGLAMASNLVSVLTAELRSQSVDRLWLILVCRDAEWPAEEGRALMELWSGDQAGRFQLQRLRYSDAEMAARRWGLSEAEAAAFMLAVQEAAVEAFAARPITLRMLVDEFQTNRKLPGTRLEIFRKACLRLCRQDPDRARFLKSATRFEFTAEQIRSVAARVAAIMLLCRHTAISRTPVGPHHLDFENLIPPKADEWQRALVEAALGSALFCDAGHQSRTFAHQSYAEYLAAEYLCQLPLAQILDLVCLRVWSKRPVVPQLSELGAWLALRHDDFADWLIEHEPEILLRNDASALTESQRERFVARLLERMACEEAFDDWDLKRFYGTIRHPKLTEQVRPYLTNPQTSRFARRAAIHLAELNESIELLEDLLAIARDVNMDCHLREEAMRAVCAFLPSEQLHELEPFARCEAGGDPHDELRGTALKALVPRQWRVSKALPHVAKPSNHNFSGAFHTAYYSYLPEQIEPDDLPVLLREIRRINHPFIGHDNQVKPIACRALVLAACHLDHVDTATEFLNLIRTKLTQQQLPFSIDEPEWKESVEDVQSRRRQLAELFVAAAGMTPQEIRQLAFYRLIPVRVDDCAWYLQRLEASSGERRVLWVQLARYFWPSVLDTTYRDNFMDACERIPELGVNLNWPIAIQLNSTEAVDCREFCVAQKRHEEEMKRQPRKPSAQEVFDAALAAAMSDWRRWYNLGWELQRGEDGRDLCSANPDPTKKYRWQVCADTVKEEIFGCARAFLISGTPEELPKREDGENAVCVFWALWLAKDRLLADEELRVAVTEKWFEALFAQPFHGASEEQILTGIGVALDPLRGAECLHNRLSRTSSGKVGMANILSSFESCWRSEFTSVLIDFVGEQNVAGSNLSSAIMFLARHDKTTARLWLDDQLTSPTPIDMPTNVALALALFSDELWQRAKSSIEADCSLALASLQTLADLHACAAGLLEGLRPCQLGDLFLLLEGAFPTASRVFIDGDDKAPRERLEAMRNLIPRRLESFASDEACEQLSRLANEVPHRRTSLRWHLRDTRLAVLRNSWPGVPFAVLLAMVEKRERRWVRSEDDLQALVIDSIRRFQDELNRTEYPTVRDLWNEKPALKPKDEIVLTQKLVKWFADDLGRKNGAAVGCQVEPSQVHETDIEVWAQPAGAAPTSQQFLITIEVKCSFNREVATSLEEQLIAEYLLKLGRTHGIYVVGWYKVGNGDRKTTHSGRKCFPRRVPKWRRFGTQAARYTLISGSTRYV